ncbi:MAG TPA: VOC family protein, partial [Acidimicrobiia bacterium]|nr:VOC family protein [Acidimicrobiia bacterium]
MQDRQDPRQPTGDDLTVERLDHVSIIVTDVERAKRFYAQVLGLAEIPRPQSFDFPGA